MNKIQDGFFAGGDSYKPLTISSDMQHMASLSFVGDQVVIRAGRNTDLEFVHAEGNIVFKIVPKREVTAATEAEVT